MKRFTCRIFVTLLLASCAHHRDPASTEVKEPTWSYQGDQGPDHWADLNKDWAACKSGHEQSPIDLKWKKPAKGHTLHFFYNDTPAKIVDNGHSIQVNFAPGSKVDIEGHVYDLVQMHFHAQSEHSLSGKHFPMEAHFVHQDDKGHWAVVAVFLKPGADNPWIEKLWKDIPAKKNEEVVLKDKTFNPKTLLPKAWTHYEYKGSMTTPPCTEGVDWNVLNTPVEVSVKQMDAFTRIYSSNNRPEQQVNQRKPANY